MKKKKEIKFYSQGFIVGGRCWDILTEERYNDRLALEQYGYKVYSQNDEDGIIQEIFKRIGTTNKIFVEFGVQDGLESNCHYLLHKDWSGLWIDGDVDCIKKIHEIFSTVIRNGQLKVKQAFITRENINSLLEDADFKGEIDLLSLDIDGNEYYVWESISVIKPRVVVVEYNGKFPPDYSWKMAYNEKHVWDGSDWHGASLKAYEELGNKLGYQLVGTNARGVNAFFVRKELAGTKFYSPATAEALYNPLRIDLNFVSSHPARYCLKNQEENLGILNYKMYKIENGFYPEEENQDNTHAWTSKQNSEISVRVDKNAKFILIPYTLPGEIINKGYSVVVSLEQQSYSYDICEPVGSLKIPIYNINKKKEVIILKIEVPFLWRPSEELNLIGDERTLGIDFILSEITCIL